jgi:hypothetical protein
VKHVTISVTKINIKEVRLLSAHDKEETCSFNNLDISNHNAPMAVQPKSGLGVRYLLPPPCSIIIGQLPIATTQKSCSILLRQIFPTFSGISN